MFAGAIVGWLVIVPWLFQNGFEAGPARSLIQNLGMGLVLGSGIGFLVSYVLPRIKSIFGPVLKSGKTLIRLYPILSVLGLFGLLFIGVPFWAAAMAVLGVWASSQ